MVAENVANMKCTGEGTLLSRIEMLPEAVLINVLCNVEHEDLRQLILVSKTFNKAALMAKKLHFDCLSPTKKLIVFQNSINLNEAEEEPEAPCAPKRSVKPRIDRNLADVSVELFTDEVDINWRMVQRKGLDTEVDARPTEVERKASQ